MLSRGGRGPWWHGLAPGHQEADGQVLRLIPKEESWNPIVKGRGSTACAWAGVAWRAATAWRDLAQVLFLDPFCCDVRMSPDEHLRLLTEAFEFTPRTQAGKQIDICPYFCVSRE